MLKRFIILTLCLIFYTLTPVHANDSTDDVMQKCQGKHPEWYQCSTNEDCTVSLDPCGWPVLGVNKFHKERSEICTRQAGAFIDCPMWKSTPENQMGSICQDGECVAVKMSEMPQPVEQPAPVE